MIIIYKKIIVGICIGILSIGCITCGKKAKQEPDSIRQPKIELTEQEKTKYQTDENLESAKNTTKEYFKEKAGLKELSLEETASFLQGDMKIESIWMEKGFVLQSNDLKSPNLLVGIKMLNGNEQDIRNAITTYQNTLVSKNLYNKQYLMALQAAKQFTKDDYLYCLIYQPEEKENLSETELLSFIEKQNGEFIQCLSQQLAK